MNYPIWEITTIGGGSLIAFIAVLHVYISHLAVGGGLFIWLTDLKGYRQNNPQIHNYIRRHTWFFLLLTMVFGGVSGVGIWFIIALVNPAGTSALIHNFVFGWAIEWVFFLGEIVALLVYHYKFDLLAPKKRLNIAFLYFLFAWLSLFIINGILSFMLTPGNWLESHSFWQGFFNPTFFSSLFFRTFMTITIAGLFGYVSSIFIKEEAFRQTMLKYCSKWLLYPLPGLALSTAWYYFSLPAAIRFTSFIQNPQTSLFVNLFIVLSAIIFAGGVLLSLKSPLMVQRLLTFLLVIIGLGWMAGFEYTREISRKPFVINQYMYSNSVLTADAEHINNDGFLNRARWTKIKKITASNKTEAGRELFNLQCLSCHTINGIRNDIVPRSEPYTRLGLLSLLNGQGKVQQYMPPFLGTEEEKETLAAYISGTLNNKHSGLQNTEPAVLKNKPLTTAAFDREKDDYILLVWSDLGMHCISDSDPWFVILPPASTLEAQLIKRGEVPELISEDAVLSYQVESGFENPAAHLEFWKYAEANFGKKLEPNIGLSGNGLSGTFHFDDERNSFIAEAIPVAPYSDDGSYNPYPSFTIQAKDNNGRVLVSTKVITPVSTEMGCKNCHEGGWRLNTLAGIDAETSTNILAVHDRINGTDLLEQALGGQPRLCQSCHADPALASPGEEDVLNFSAAMHGWHANYMPFDDSRACMHCHPAAPGGNTRCNRGVHKTIGLECTNCHGTMQEHGLALLKGQLSKPPAKRLMANLQPASVSGIEEINPRLPWLNEPDCLTCHEDFEKPQPGFNSFNTWNEEMSELYRMRTDNVGIRCAACHGSTHALYPAQNPYHKNRDNQQPLQYSGSALPIGSNFDCAVCHTVQMEDAVHHENMERYFRNADRY